MAGGVRAVAETFGEGIADRDVTGPSGHGGGGALPGWFGHVAHCAARGGWGQDGWSRAGRANQGGTGRSGRGLGRAASSSARGGRQRRLVNAEVVNARSSSGRHRVEVAGPVAGLGAVGPAGAPASGAAAGKTQSTGSAPICRSSSLAREKGREPKNPRLADSGLGCGEV